MHFTTTLLLSTLTLSTAAPLIPRQTIALVQVNLDDSDGASIVQVKPDELTATKAPATRGVGAQLNSGGLVCLGFSDAEGTRPLLPVFDSSEGVVYAADSAERVDIGAFFCSLDRAVVEGFAAAGEGSRVGGESQSGGQAQDAEQPQPAEQPQSSETPNSVTITFETSAGTEFRQATFPANNIQQAAPGFASSGVVSLSLNTVTSGANASEISCQAFDSQNEEIGGAVTGDQVVELADGEEVPVAFVTCRSV